MGISIHVTGLRSEDDPEFQKMKYKKFIKCLMANEWMDIPEINNKFS